MKKEKIKCNLANTCNNGCGGFGYVLGFIGAVVYYISTTTGFWNTVLAILKALVWPAFLVYGLLKSLGI